MKYRAIVRITAVVALGVAAVAAIRYLDRIPPQRLMSLLGITVTVSELTTPTPSVSVVPVSDQVPELALGTVAVQTYAGTSLVRSAAGTVVSSDGLIVTTAAAAPYGSGSFLYQVTSAKGAVARARRVAYDGATGLVLLRAEGMDTDGVTLGSAAQLRAGDQLLAVGASVTLARYVPAVLPVTVVSAARPSHVVLSLDRTQLTLLSGARLVDRRGTTVGILRPGSVPGIIDASAVEGFVRKHLDSLR